LIHPHPPKASALLSELREAFPGEEAITVRTVLARLEGRAIGVLLLLLALPNCIPNIPGISTIFGLLLIPPALQLTFGAGNLWLPRRLADQEIAPKHLRMGIDGALPALRRVEKLVQPRFEFLVQKPFSIWFGVQTLILAGVLILPIPFGNWPPGMSVAALALALLQRDGVLAIVSFAIFLASLVTAYLGARIGLAALNELIQVLAEWAELGLRWLHSLGG
jgi:hypothetical protein